MPASESHPSAAAIAAARTTRFPRGTHAGDRSRLRLVTGGHLPNESLLAADRNEPVGRKRCDDLDLLLRHDTRPELVSLWASRLLAVRVIGSEILKTVILSPTEGTVRVEKSLHVVR
jgi:hypothetical protein